MVAHENFIQTSSIKIGIKNFYDSKRKSCKVSNECYINILLVGSKNTYKYALITADIIWFSDQCVRIVKNLLSKEIRISVESIMLSASHTHGTPNPEKSIVYPEYSESFDNYVYKVIIKTFQKTILKKKKKDLFKIY